MSRMSPVVLGGTLHSSALGLGCAGLFRLASPGARRVLLETALEHGIAHVDTAPMYGLGRSEPELGQFLRGRRDQVVVATKFGIAPTTAARAIGVVQAPVRWLLARRPDLQQGAQERAAGPSSGAGGALLYRQVGYDGPAARRSLDSSLRRLGTDHVDLLLLHDPEPGSARTDDVCAALEDARTVGKLRTWGVAGEPGPAAGIADQLPLRPPVLQVRDDVLEPIPAGARADVVFGALGRAVPALLAHLRTPDGSAVASRLDIGPDDREGAARLLLGWALVRHPRSTVLFSTTRPDRIRAAAALLEDLPAGDDPRFLALDALGTHLRTAGNGTTT